MKNYDKNKESSYLQYWDVNNLYIWAMSQKLPVNNFEWIEYTFQFKTEYVIHIKNLKQALNHGLVLKKVHRVIKFNQNAWLKPYIDMNTDVRKKQKMILKKTFLR